jgi:putative membrane protein
MVADHTATTQSLQAALQSVTNAPALPAALDQRHQQMVQDLRDAAAANFDQRYVDQQLAAHQKALNTHQGYANNGDNAAVRSFAAETAPKVQHHLDMIREIDGSGADEPADHG